LRVSRRSWVECRVVGQSTHRVHKGSIRKEGMKIATAVERAVVHEVIVQEVVE